jgi:CRISPR-associated exonuclease Cas4
LDARQLVAAGALPPPIDNRAKCRDCSLQPLCLPDEVRRLNEDRETMNDDWERKT